MRASLTADAFVASTALNSLHIADNDFAERWPIDFASALPALTSLDLRNSRFVGALPASFGTAMPLLTCKLGSDEFESNCFQATVCPALCSCGAALNCVVGASTVPHTTAPPDATTAAQDQTTPVGGATSAAGGDATTAPAAGTTAAGTTVAGGTADGTTHAGSPPAMHAGSTVSGSTAPDSATGAGDDTTAERTYTFGDSSAAPASTTRAIEVATDASSAACSLTLLGALALASVL